VNAKAAAKEQHIPGASSDAELIAGYRAKARQRRIDSELSVSKAAVVDVVQSQQGIVTVALAPGSKPVSLLGGAAKVFGHSHISIPEYKR
jgi:hypothetical protein